MLIIIGSKFHKNPPPLSQWPLYIERKLGLMLGCILGAAAREPINKIEPWMRNFQAEAKGDKIVRGLIILEQFTGCSKINTDSDV